MSGIYIHIPFCLQACSYCDFHFSTSLQNKDSFLKALEKEIKLRSNYLSTSDTIESIYFGGGTPSLLSAEELLRIFELLHTHFTISSDAEITLEANPEDLSNEKVRDFKTTPINRFSIGIQSFFEADLKFMHRAHSAERGINAVKTAQDAGFENISIDLIYGTPTLSNDNWKINLQQVFDLQVKHISAYCLTIEERTALHKHIASGKVQNVEDEKSAQHFEILTEAMQKNGFIQYEISNFCTENNYSRHNSNYWKQKKYIGLGPSAHSYDGASRQWNVRNNALYIRSLEKNELNFERETLTREQNYNEYIMTSIRTIWGCDLVYIQKEFGTDLLNFLKKEATTHFTSGNIIEKENQIFLTEKGKLLADKIASDLFFTDKLA